MDVNISAAITKINEMINGFIAALPNVVIAAIVLVLFLFIATWVKKIINQVGQRSGLSHSASLLMGRLSRWLVIFFGILVTLSIVIPSFNYWASAALRSALLFETLLKTSWPEFSSS